jgi:hypothetical protein
MKNLFEISSEEKQRILEMHESATKRNYLMEADPINPPKQVTTKPAQTKQIMPGAETKAGFQDAVNWLKNATIGADFQSVINSYRTGNKEGFVKGKDQYYYWTATVTNGTTGFSFLELFPDGLLSEVVTLTYMPNADPTGKLWSWEGRYTEANTSSQNTLTHIRTDPGLRGMETTFFWESLLNSTKYLLDTTQLLRFLKLNLQMDKPYTFKNAVGQKTDLYKNEKSGIDDNLLNAIKSSDIYKSLT